MSLCIDICIYIYIHTYVNICWYMLIQGGESALKDVGWCLAVSIEIWVYTILINFDPYSLPSRDLHPSTCNLPLYHLAWLMWPWCERVASTVARVRGLHCTHLTSSDHPFMDNLEKLMEQKQHFFLVKPDENFHGYIYDLLLHMMGWNGISRGFNNLMRGYNLSGIMG